MGSWFAQAIESGAWRERPADLLLVTDDAGRRDHVRPIRRGEADCFLQLVAGGWVLPHKDDVRAVAEEPQRGRAFRCHGVDLLRTEGQSATLTTTQFAALRKRLKEIGGVDFLAAPKISTLSGRQARIEMSEITTIVNGVQVIPESATTKAHINYQTENDSTGPSVDITPTLEGNTAQLAIVAKVTEFLGYDQPTESQRVLATQPGEKPVKGTLPLPRLRVRSVQATALVNFDDTMVLRGPLVTERLRTKDKVPILGDLPLVGRPFRTEGETTIRKRLYIFVTPFEVIRTASLPVSSLRGLRLK